MLKRDAVFKVALAAADGLRGAALNREAKRIELAVYAKSEPWQFIDLLTIVERAPGIGADTHRLVAMAKKIIGGDETLFEEFNELVAYMNGMGPSPGYRQRS